jgi:dihydropteroate synthase
MTSPADNDMAIEPSDDVAIAQELAALGELPVEDDELRFHRAGADARADADVATVATLVEIGGGEHFEGDTRPLSEIERRRAWNRVADRLESSGHAVKRAVGSRSVWRSVVAGLAMAAGVAIIPRIVPDGPVANSAPARSSAAEAEAVAEAARSGLEALGDEYDTDRAEGVLSEYADRLKKEAARP